MNTNNSMYYRYFVYSREDETMKQKLYGIDYKFGNVMVHGVPKRYTSIEKDPSKAKPDAIIVAKGDIRKINYTSAR